MRNIFNFQYSSTGSASQIYLNVLPQCAGSISNEQFLGVFHVIEIHFEDSELKGSG